ncbi:MAG TPA: endospore germination permease [Bacillota bacterium]|jgi:spore germination protein KB|nr:endospore germination permease [Bacillota bacterium]
MKTARTAETKGTAETAGDRPKDEIYYTQIVVITAMIVFATGFLAAARILVPVAGTAAWISALIGGVIGLGIVVLAGYLAARFPDHSLVRMAERIFGAPLGKLIGLTFAAYCTVVLGLGSRESVLAIWIAFLQTTPPIIISGVFYALIIYAAYLGIEAIARVSLIFFTLVVISLLVLTALAVPVVVPGRLLPVVGNGLRPLIHGGFLAASYAGESVVVLAFIRHLKDKRSASRAMATGVAAGMVVMATATGFGVMMLGVRGISRVTFPVLETARMVGFGQFLERAEILFLALWFSAALLKLAAVFYASITSVADVLGLRDYRPLIIPYALLGTALSLIPKTVLETFDYLSMFVKYSVWYAIALPVVLLVGAVVRGSRRGGENVRGKDAR